MNFLQYRGCLLLVGILLSMANIFVSGKTSIMDHVAVFEAYRMDVGTGTCTRQQGDYDLNALFANINKATKLKQKYF